MAAPLLDISLKAGLLLAAAWFISLALGRASAAVRHVTWVAAAGGVLLLPALTVLLPAWTVPVPVYEWSGLAFRAQAHAGHGGRQAPARHDVGLVHPVLPRFAIEHAEGPAGSHVAQRAHGRQCPVVIRIAQENRRLRRQQSFLFVCYPTCGSAG